MWKITVAWLLSSMVTAQTCDISITSTTPSLNFQIINDGTVIDTKTGLMWKRCPEGQSGSDCAEGNASLYNWQEALQQSEIINTTGGFSGYMDWRLPNIKELQSIVEEQCIGPAINLAVFPLKRNLSVWSGSPYSSFGDNAWSVDFDKGFAHPSGARPHSKAVLLLRIE